MNIEMTDYIKFYGFSENPFDLSANSKFFFSSESHGEALAALSYGITQRKGFVLILGESGIGKTTLINQIKTMYRLCQTPYFGLIGKTTLTNRILDTIGANVKIIYFPRSDIAFDQMLKEILFSLNLRLREGTKGTMLHELYHYLISALERDENVVIILDEAQNISLEAIEELRLLSNLETSKSKLLQIVIVGQPELKGKLRAEVIRQINQRIVISAQISPITAEECIHYIDHRLSIIGSSSSEVFTDEALSLICKYAKGIPRAINIICSNALSVGCYLSEKQISSSTVKKVRRAHDILTPEQVQKLVDRIKRNLPRKVAVAVFILAVMLTGAYFISDPMRHFVNTHNFKTIMKQLAFKAKDDTTQRHADSEVTPAIQKTETFQTPPDKKQDATTLPPPETTAKMESVAKTVVEARVGMNLSSLTLKYYNEKNETLMDYILELNPKITNPNLILIKQKIMLPEITESLLVKKSSDGMFHVHLATFPNTRDAARYIENNNLKEKNVEIVRRQVSQTQTWYRVLAGPYASRDEALKFIEAKKQNGLLPFLKKTPNHEQ
ncbi:MAG: AAA family ATPase [Syntrophaceae bacterium]